MQAWEQELRRELPEGAEIFDAHVHLGTDIDGFRGDYDELERIQQRFGVSRSSLREATRAWFLISLQTFGGPAGQIAVMQRTLVDERRVHRIAESTPPTRSARNGSSASTPSRRNCPEPSGSTSPKTRRSQLSSYRTNLSHKG